MKKIVVTGGAGYIGSHAVKLLLEKGFEVVVFDNLSRGYSDAVDVLKSYGNISFVKGDLRNVDDLDDLCKDTDIHAVMHFAALCLVNESMEHPELYFYNNTVGTYNLLEAMRINGLKKLIFSSTCAVYGESRYLPVDENHPLQPMNPYGESKFLSEKMIRWYGEIHGFSYAILRYFNVCGASSDGRIGDSKRPSELLMQNAVRGAMKIEPFYLTCPEVNTPDGTPVRDYIDVEDLVAAHAAALQYLDSGGASEIFNLGNGTGYSVKQIVSKVEDVCGVSMPLMKKDTRKGEYSIIYAQPEKANASLHWKTEKDLAASIRSLQKWYEGHPQGFSH
jgi:UDP-glucose 4-epimerase